MTEMYLRILGRVQGVGYRNFVRKNAGELGILGWVRNNEDGSVTLAIKGNEEDIEQMIKICEKGPLFANVTSIESLESFDFPEIFGSEFKII